MYQMSRPHHWKHQLGWITASALCATGCPALLDRLTPVVLLSDGMRRWTDPEKPGAFYTFPMRPMHSAVSPLR